MVRFESFTVLKLIAFVFKPASLSFGVGQIGTVVESFIARLRSIFLSFRPDVRSRFLRFENSSIILGVAKRTENGSR